MSDSKEAKSFSWQTLLAIGGLIATLIGVYIQYSSSQEENRQAQAKQDAADQEVEDRNRRSAKQRSDLIERLEILNSERIRWELEIKRLTNAIVFAPDDQKPLAARLLKEAGENRATVVEEARKLQEKIDALPPV